MKTAFILVFISFVISGCSGPQNQTHEIAGTQAERVLGVSRVIESNATLPSEIADAHLIELQFGDGRLGPSDFRSFVWIKVSPDDIDKWKSILKSPPNQSVGYDQPPANPAWWVAEATFDKSTKYDSDALFNRHGWIVIEDDGNIFALTYTQ